MERVEDAGVLSAYHRDRLARAGEAARQGTLETAVVMLADLSGFSRISAGLVARQDRSAEDLAAFLNALSDRIADVVAAHGGCVTGHAGDATIAIWTVAGTGVEAPGPEAPGFQVPGPEAVVTARALACGLALQAALHDVHDPALAPVRLKVGVDCGAIWAADLCLGQGRRHLHLAGPVLEGLAAIGALAEPGQVAIPAATHARLGLSSVGVNRGACRVVTAIAAAPDPAPAKPVAAAFAPEALAAHVPGWLSGLLAQTERRWLAEFRSATVLFVALSGPGAAGPHAARRMERVFSALLAAVEAAGGLLLQLMHDDKGLTVICAWGLASNTHEDDPARAVMAGQALLRLFQAQGLGCGMGVASGKVLAGLIGGRRTTQYSLIGDTVNRAAALSGLGRDRLFADQQTATAAAGRFAFATCQQVALKGDTTPRTVFADPSERRHVVPETHGFVGRARELALVCARLSAAAVPGPVVHVQSNAGMGKSRLLAEVLGRLAGEGRRIVLGAGDSLRRGSSLHMWREVFGTLLPDAPPERLRMLQGLAADDESLRARLPLLAALVDAVIPETPQTRALDTAARGRLTVEATAQAAAALLRDRADLLIVEDAHWLDSLSWQVLAELRRRLPGLALLILSRPLDPAALPRAAAQMLAGPAATTVPLAGFTRAEAAALAAGVLGVDDLPEDVARLIDRRCEGIPLYIKELTCVLRDRGILRVRQRRCIVTGPDRALDEIDLPEGIAGVVASRISTLDAAAQLTLKAAAVAGRDFDLPQLAAIRPAGPDLDELRAQVQAIRRTGLIEAAGPGPNPGPNPGPDRFRFHHALIQKTAHDLLVQAQKVELHAAAARWLETRQGDASLIAHHWAQAADHRRAMDWYDRAALIAVQGNAPAEVVAFATRARDHGAQVRPAPDRLRRGHWLFLEGNARKQLGDYRACVDTLRDAIDHLGRPVPRRPLPATLGVLRELARLKLRPRPGGLPAADRPQAVMVAEAFHAMSEITYLWGETTQTLYGVLHALNLCEAMGADSPVMAKTLMTAAMVGLSAPWAIDPVACRDRALAMCARIDDDSTWSWVLLTAGVFETSLGDMHAALGYLERCPAICERIGAWQPWRSAMASIGNALRIDGRAAAAREVQHRLMAEAVDSGNVLAQVWAQSALSKSLTLLGALDELDHCLERFAGLVERQAHAGDRNLDIGLRLGQTTAHVAARRDGPALAHLSETVRLIDSVTNPALYTMDTATMLCDVIEVLRLRGHDPALLATAMRANLRFVNRLAAKYPGVRAKALYVRGDHAALAGRTRRAARLWEAARAEAAARRLRLDEAQACLRLARRAGRADAAALEIRAGDILRALQLPVPPLWAAQQQE